ncbi:MarR family winged helix-turn-helix transcriptional regulator [Acrocarpospora catenulata]|uniref:MarR family winged helix-turn-helix transcriptional regulator n=1 Tax=Acrocarpospora catenulata TaxID=2836182 RepID=UPI001BDA5FC9|nr:MarR family transcriptional regulator [Acrocarpospora catenulata]
MPRPARARLASPADAELGPVRPVEQGTLLASLSTIIYWADSHEVRAEMMRAAGFPIPDVTLFLVVNHLAHRGALRPTDLARMLGTGPSNVTKIIHRLYEAGLVLRTADPDDDRSVLIALSPAGRVIGRRILDHAADRVDAIVDTWPADEREALRRMLARLADAAIADGYRPAPHA